MCHAHIEVPAIITSATAAAGKTRFSKADARLDSLEAKLRLLEAHKRQSLLRCARFLAELEGAMQELQWGEQQEEEEEERRQQQQQQQQQVEEEDFIAGASLLLERCGANPLEPSHGGDTQHEEMARQTAGQSDASVVVKRTLGATWLESVDHEAVPLRSCLSSSPPSRYILAHGPRQKPWRQQRLRLRPRHHRNASVPSAGAPCSPSFLADLSYYRDDCGSPRARHRPASCNQRRRRSLQGSRPTPGHHSPCGCLPVDA